MDKELKEAAKKLYHAGIVSNIESTMGQLRFLIKVCRQMDEAQLIKPYLNGNITIGPQRSSVCTEPEYIRSLTQMRMDLDDSKYIAPDIMDELENFKYKSQAKVTGKFYDNFYRDKTKPRK